MIKNAQGLEIVMTYASGEKVWLDNGNGTYTKYTVDCVIPNILTNMVTFVETNIAVGVMYVKRKKSQKNGKMSDYLHNAPHNRGKSYAEENILEEGFNPESRSMLQSEGTRNFANKPDVLFFRPNNTMIEWIAKYAGDRVIIDVGCGSARLTTALADQGCKVVGIDPFLDDDNVEALVMSRMNAGKSMIQLLPKKIEDMKALFVGAGDKVLLMFARPCHSDFVYNTLNMKDESTEVLYITVPKNLEKYDDLGEYIDRAVTLNPEGYSADDEVFLSIK